MKLYILSVFFIACVDSYQIGDSCKGVNNVTGICRRVSDCSSHIDLKSNSEHLVKNRCGFDGISLIVCCPHDSDSRLSIEKDCRAGSSLGICMPVEECSFFFASSERMKNAVNKHKCGWHESLVCCPYGSGTRISSQTYHKSEKKSNVACNQFGERPKPSVVTNSRIVGGSAASANEFPQFAALGYKNLDTKLSFDCGGSLISENFVLSAAHCSKSKRRQPTVVRLGIGNYLDEGADFDVEKVFNHPGFQGISKYNDISLIELKTSAELSFAIWPACLIQENPLLDASLIIAGFGQMSLTDTNLKSDRLLQATVEEIPLLECRQQYQTAFGNEKKVLGLNEGIQESLLCAKNRTKHADSCRGDSGTGLYLLRDKTYYVVGVTSFGVSCNTSLPAFYTRVWSYLEWIESVVWPDL